VTEEMKKINCDDYINCAGCPFRKFVDMDIYDENGNYTGKETILFCERNGKVSDVFKEGNLKDLLEE